MSLTNMSRHESLNRAFCFARQACSILYKTRLPLLLVFNKIDATSHDFALEWMSDFESFSAAIAKESSYASTLSRSLSLVRQFPGFWVEKSFVLGFASLKMLLKYCNY